MQKFFIAITALMIAGVGFFFLFNKNDTPSITYQTLDGVQVSSTDLKGKVVLVKFWATTCITCIQQMPDLIKYYDTYKDKGYETIAVAMHYDDPTAIRKFRESYHLPFMVVHDKSGQIATEFGGIRFTPIAFLLDRQGHIVKRYIGNYNKQEFIHTLKKTLDKS